MKVKQYIVTYNNSEILNNWILKSMFESLSESELSITDTTIINNHTNFIINSEYVDRGVKVIHNVLRPDFSTGHLARNWNESVIHGFKSLTDPDCDIVILMQHDTIVEKNYIDKLIDIHNKGITFYTAGSGDQFMSQTVNSVKRVGLWDERFCNIGYQDADYFIRQVIYNTDNISINDYDHLRLHNPIDVCIVKNTLPGVKRKDIHHQNSSRFHDYCGKLWYSKYNYNHWDWDTDEIIRNKNTILNKVPYYVYYPYFEKDVETLVEQGLIWDKVEDKPWF